MDLSPMQNLFGVLTSMLTVGGLAWSAYLQYRRSEDSISLRLLGERHASAQIQLKDAQIMLGKQQDQINGLLRDVALGTQTNKERDSRIEDLITLSALLVEEYKQTSTNAVVVADLDEIVQGANSAAAVLWGYSKAEMIGMKLTVLMPERFRDQHHAMVSKAREAKSIINRFPMELPILKKDGTEELHCIRILGWVSTERQSRFVAIVMLGDGI